MEPHIVEELQWLNEKANEPGISKKEKDMLLRIANNYKFISKRNEKMELHNSWSKNPERMGR